MKAIVDVTAQGSAGLATNHLRALLIDTEAGTIALYVLLLVFTHDSQCSSDELDD